MIAVPSILTVAPNGIVNDDTSRETPISSSLSIFIGIVAFEDDAEKANSITLKNFLKNLIGFNRVSTTINEG